jgi:hypothetical protein
MKSYKLTLIDVWQALIISASVGVVVLGVSLGCLILPLFIYNPRFYDYLATNLVLLVFAALPALYYGVKTWLANTPFFEIDTQLQTVSFCAADVEQSIQSIVTFKTFRSQWRRTCLSAADIVGLDNQANVLKSGKYAQKSFSLNISTEHGSQQLTFSSKQKRDECRARLLAYLKTLAKNPPASPAGDLASE